MKYELSPSILSADFARLGEEIKAVEQTGVNYLHIDVMDGMFVPSISFGFPIIKSIRKMSNMVFDVHLMVEQPERYIEETAASGADIITIHAEACKHPDRAIEQIHQLGKKAGIALNPSTSLHELDYLLEKVDMVLLMTVNPGFGNQKYIPYCTGKVKELRTMIEERGLQTDIEVDGGINAATIDAVLEAGANILVAGSAVFGKEKCRKIPETAGRLSGESQMKRAVIISGGKIQTDFALAFLRTQTWDYVIGADKGVIFCHKNQIMPTHIVGDFDSAGETEYEYFQKNTDVPIKRLNPVKDYTDTDVALRLALELGAEEITILGGTGARIDHTAANVRILFLALQKGVRAYLLDEHNKMWLTDHAVSIKKEEQFGKYLSLFAMGGAVKDLTLQGVFYPLDHYLLEGMDPLCVSNEITEEACRINFSEGVLLVIESKD